MARVTRTKHPFHRRPASRRLGFIAACCALLLVVAGCSGGDSVFTTNPDGSPATQGTLPGGLVGPGTSDPGTSDPGTSGPGRGPGASADAVPAGAQAYAGFDLTAVPDLMRLVETFEEVDLTSLGEGLDLGEGLSLGEELGLGLGDGLGLEEGAGEAAEGVEEARDVLSCLTGSLLPDPNSLPGWMGSEAGLALFDMRFDAASGDMTDPNALAVIELADRAAAEAGLQQIVTALETCTDTPFEQTTYQGVAVYRADPGDGEPPVAIALTEDYMLFGVGTAMVERGLDLGGGPSLADDPNFAEVLSALPGDRHLTAVMGMDLIQQMMESLGGSLAESDGMSLPPGLDPTQALAGMRGLGMAATMLPEGIRVDMVAVGEPTRPLPFAGSAAGGLPGLLPGDALGFLGTGAFDVPAAWGSLMEVLEQIPMEEGEPGIADSISLIGAMLGIDIEADLIAQLSGEVGVGLLPATVGSLAEGTGVNLGLIAVMGVEDSNAMAATVETMAGGLGEMMGMPAGPRPFAGGTLYALSDGTADMLLFGMAGANMVLTTHESHAAALLAGGPKLAGSARYAEATGALPQGSVPMMYLDIAALIAALDLEEAEAAAVAPLQTVAMSASFATEAMRATVYLRIDY